MSRADADRAQAWAEAIVAVARHYRLACSVEAVHLAAAWEADADGELALQHAARQAGLAVVAVPLSAERLSTRHLPLVLELQDGCIAVLDALSEGVQGEDGQAELRLMGDDGLRRVLPRDALLASVKRVIHLRPLRGLRDARVDAYIPPYRRHWLFRLVLRDLRPYLHVMLASLAANVLALSGVLFSMQVYDRVVPAQSLPTLYVLFTGVLLATVFAFLMRLLRAWVTDMLGKRADLRVSDRVFGHALRLRSTARPRSTGSFIAQLRELESIRELVTSSTIGVLADLPFFLLFLGVFAFIAPPLAWIPPVALLLMLIPGLLLQGKLAEKARMALRESSLRNALLVEAVQGLDDIKTLQAELRFQQQWNVYNAATAEAGMALRQITQGLTAWGQTVQTTVFAVVVLFGAPLIMQGEMTTGALVAASILASRMLAPMGQLNQVLGRWQQAKVAIRSLDGILQLPVDQPEDSQRIHRPQLHGDYVLKDALFRHAPDLPPALRVASLQIQAGERIAILGRNGAGKSTLLQALAGGLDQLPGSLSLDGVALEQLDAADLRRDVAWLSQSARLFHGSLRDNLLLGVPLADDAALMAALALTGVDEWLKRLPQGLDYPLMEGGVGLSGGQRQSLLLARLLLRQPNILLLDEPTSALDDNTERRFLDALDHWLSGRTLIVATHRMAVLQRMQRVIVVDQGRIVLDAPREEAVARLSRRGT